MKQNEIVCIQYFRMCHRTIWKIPVSRYMRKKDMRENFWHSYCYPWRLFQ